MFFRKLSQSDWFFIIANLLPVYGVWFLKWDPKIVFLVYCVETIIIGFFTLMKLAMVTVVKKKDVWQNEGSSQHVHGLFFMLFFILHYGFFVFVQISIFFNVVNFGSNDGMFEAVLKWPSYINKEAGLMLGIFFISYGYKSLTEFILSENYKTASMMSVMFEPYIRIFIQQVTVILGSFFLMFGAGKIFILVFAIVRILFEVILKFDGRIKAAIMKKSLVQQ